MKIKIEKKKKDSVKSMKKKMKNWWRKLRMKK